MTKPVNDNKKSNGWTKPDPEQAAQDEAHWDNSGKHHPGKPDPIEELKQQAEQAQSAEKLEFTKADVIKAHNLGLWYGKRLGRLYELQRTMPYVEKYNTRLQKAGRKVGILKQALRAQIDANTLSAEALDD